MAENDKTSRKTIEVSGKHIKLRFVLFLIALVIGLVAFGVMFYQIANRDPGYYEITATRDETAPYYANGFHLYCYFDGSSSEIKNDVRGAEELYTESLGRIRRLLDADATYDGYTNLATLNESIGQAVSLPVELYTVLTETFARGEAEGFFAADGVLRGLWQELLYLEDPVPFDPQNDETERERMDAIAASLAEPNAVTLEIVDAVTYTVRLSVSETLREVMTQHEVNVPIVDLGILGEAYALKYVAGKLTAGGFTHGYLVTDSGLAVMLRDTANGELPICVSTDEAVFEAGTIALTSGTSCASLRTFDAEGVKGYYSLDGLRRHPYLSAENEPNRALSAVWTVSDDVVDAAWTALCLYHVPNGTASDRLAALPEGTKAALAIMDDPYTLTATAALLDALTPNEADGFAKTGA